MHRASLALLGLLLATSGGCDAGSHGVPSLEAPPSIVSQPGDLTVPACDDAAFAVTATGTAPLVYQWYRSGIAIAGATDATYVVVGVLSGDDGATFSVSVVNGAGSTSSRLAVLRVTASPPPAPGPVIIAPEGGNRIAVNNDTIAWTTFYGVHVASKPCARPVRSVYERTSYLLSTWGIVLAPDRVVWTDANYGRI